LIALVTFETALILGLVAVAAWLRLGRQAWDVFVFEDGVSKALVVTLVTQGCLYFADLYSLRRTGDRRDHMIRMIQALAAASFILAALYYWFPELIIGRGVFLLAAILIVGGIVGWRSLYDAVSLRIGLRERLLLVGTNETAVALARELHEQGAQLGVEIVGFIDADKSRVGAPVVNPGVVGTIEDIPRIVAERDVDRVVVSLVDARGRLPMNDLLQMKLDSGVRFDQLPAVYEEFTGKIAVDNLRPSWLIFSEGFRKTRVQLALKRALDVTCAALGLLLAAPLVGLVALAVRLSSPGPIFYHQDRVGQRGRVFTVHKFRSMRDDAEAATGAVWASADDPRVTAVGRFLRRSRLDELPQLWNVLRGDMSMVGPRPERPEFVSQLTLQIPFYGIRHSVRPGVTGWAQVSYTYGASVEDALEKLQFDLFYMKHMNLAFDVFVLFSTIKTVLLRRGAQ
jgi:sugar transferase (PEP-CTERM system associated)